MAVGPGFEPGVPLRGTADLRILDIGSGSHSSSITKKWLPNCHYTGVDRDANYDNTPRLRSLSFVREKTSLLLVGKLEWVFRKYFLLLFIKFHHLKGTQMHH